MKKQKFMRTDFRKYSKLGLRRKKKQKYRKSKGTDNKIRLKMKGHLRNVNSGFRSEKKTRELINGLKPIIVCNLDDLKNLKKGEIGIIARIGNKKKIEIANYALKNNLKLKNLEPKKFLEKIEVKIKEAKKEKQKRKEKRKLKDKKAKEKAEKERKKAEKEEAKKEKSEEKNETNKEKAKSMEEKKGETKEENKLDKENKEEEK